MGNVVSLVDIQHSNPASEEVASEESVSEAHRRPSAPARTTTSPSHILLTFLQVLGAFVLPPVISPSPGENPFDSPPSSPALSFHTAPSTPVTSPQGEDPPPDPPPVPTFDNSRPPSPPLTDHHPIASVEIETIPSPEALSSPDFALDFTLDDEGLSTLEKIYLFSRSRSAHHRVFISHALPAFLAQVSPIEAVEYVLPLLPSLSVDEDEAVKEALSAELVSIMWWFLTHCRLVEEPSDLSNADFAPQHQSDDQITLISVQAFTPILATLLLSSNGVVSGSARFAVVELLARIHRADDLGDQQVDDPSYGLFERHERSLFEEEVIQQLVIGMGRLESGEDENDADVWYTPAIEHPQPDHPLSRNGSVNPYFPSTQTPSPSAISISATALIPPFVPNLPSPPVGVPPPHHEVELIVVDPSPLAILSLQLEGQHSPIQPNAEGSGEREIISGATTYAESGRSDFEMDGQEEEQEMDPSEQAAVGRLSSMSLIAAVVAGGTPRVETQRTFVREVERVGRDPIHWVRREASFALGALAKVVPDELIIGSLLPLFESLRTDPAWHVRHSCLFALPALLSRLPSGLRRSVAVSTILPLSRDESAPVRSGVLEALGEVVYTFHSDECGPPDDLLSLFLGKHRNCPPRERYPYPTLQSPFQQLSANVAMQLFDDDPARPLACAFNFPAVAYTLGRARWGELRGLYLTLAQDRSSKVRRTLAASLGDLAKIVGPENAQRDMISLWWDVMRSDDDNEIKFKAIEAVPLFVEALGEGQAREEVITGLLDVWEEGWLRNWRAREGVIKIIPDLTGGPERPNSIRALLRKGLEDDFGAVRETAISVICRIALQDVWRPTLNIVHQDMLSLANSPIFRRRMTFVACQQALASSVGGLSILVDDARWRTLERLSNDSIVGVRIGVARLAGSIFENALHATSAVPHRIFDMIDHLQQDSSAEVRSYIPSVANLQQGQRVFPSHSDSFLTFSRPPPLLCP
ncbi:armadillo-type protein [Suillus paluster]|uniref:armadillo-type protein n=1 Tax=Suillus paluster TaxID=48578 RepID=UPI001B868A7B|nr:armadillo-type protein [Suillus paluster]KAG1756528.1 armadillo-type protein [Suillus paluster]